MNDIADAAGVSHGTVYTYFESKEEILGQVIDELLVELRDDLRTSAKDPDGPHRGGQPPLPTRVS